MINELINLINQYEKIGEELNKVNADLRVTELELKTRKYELEFDPEYTKGLKVKEVAPKIHKDTLKDTEEICELKQKRDELELQFKIISLKIQYTKEVLESQKINTS